MVRRLIPLGPLLVVLGALVLIVASGSEIASSLRGWVAGQAPWPRGVLLDALVAGSAFLLAIAVLMTRRSVIRTAKVEEALRESEERLRLVANNVPALISYVDREQRYRFSNRTYDDWFGISQERMLGRTFRSEERDLRAERQDEVVVDDRLHLGEPHLALRQVDRGHRVEMDPRVRVLVKEVAQGMPDGRGLEQVRCHLVEERLKGVVVVLVDDDDVGVDLLQRPRSADAREAPAQDEDDWPRALGTLRLIRHRRSNVKGGGSGSIIPEG